MPTFDTLAKLLASLAMLVAMQAQACTNMAVGAHLATYHFDRQANHNEVNPGLYAMCDGWTAGIYRNSERSTSYYAGRTVRVAWFDITVGAISGYRRGTVPMLVPSILLPGGLRLAFLPPIPKAGSSTAGIHLMKEF